MLVTATQILGTIGGGQLEFEAIAHARDMLAGNAEVAWLRELRTWPLGPSLGQCCGGTVRVLFERYSALEHETCVRDLAMAANGAALVLHDIASGHPPVLVTARQDAKNLPLPLARTASDMLSGARALQPMFLPARAGQGAYFIEPVAAARIPLFVYGAGHVGQAIVKIASDLEFDILWVDTHAERFPPAVPAGVTKVAARQPERVAAAAPSGAFHLVLTYSHAIDLAICQALLAAPDFRFLGLIGSKTKKARFLSRLRESGIASPTLARLTCPIGIGAMRGKEPATIAVGAAAQLIEQRERLRQWACEGRAGDDGTGKQIPA